MSLVDQWLRSRCWCTPTSDMTTDEVKPNLGSILRPNAGAFQSKGRSRDGEYDTTKSGRRIIDISTAPAPHGLG